jgi:Do/DeqQ family serine protease
MKKLIFPILLGLFGAIIGGVVVELNTDSKIQYIQTGKSGNNAKLTNYKTVLDDGKFNMDFTLASGITTPSVVHIKSKVKSETAMQNQGGDFFYHFFRDDRLGRPYQQKPQERESSGSGVIISNDGYIVTNNHVINDASEIEVVLNDKRSYKAKVIGKDPSTDIALVKVDAEELPSIDWANSDDVNVGEWVLAVGNPFNLASTVTAGIVSAKGRNINILKDKGAIESFIQTDAAVNPGNSGGALVNLRGELVGINTAIATPTGTYAGYSFAVPSNIVQKVIGDLREFGVVQRAYIGVFIKDINNELAEDLGLKDLNGVFVQGLTEGGAADEAGIKEGDVITKINDVEVKTAPELQEEIAQYRPGDVINIILKRDGKLATVNMTLRNKSGNTKLVDKPSSKVLNVLGIELEELSQSFKVNNRIRGGVQIKRINKGKVQDETVVKEGFVITKIDDESIKNVDDFNTTISSKEGGVMFEGFYPGKRGSYYFAIGL